MKEFFVTLPRNVVGCFTGWRIIWHLTAIMLTVMLVQSGFDWRYFQVTDDRELRAWMFPAAIIGFFLPIGLPVLLFLTGILIRNAGCTLAAMAVAQAEIIGLVVSSIYKAFTGRAHPFGHMTEDLTHVFHFGFLRGGMFWGWPSSHTTIAFAMAVAVFKLFPRRRWIGFSALAYATYIGVGVSMTIHWFSDFVAGAIIGTLIGTVVGGAFSRAETEGRVWN